MIVKYVVVGGCLCCRAAAPLRRQRRRRGQPVVATPLEWLALYTRRLARRGVMKARGGHVCGVDQEERGHLVFC